MYSFLARAGRRGVLLLVLAALLTGLSGCGGPRRKTVYPVHGQVFVDGRPAVEALVYFWAVDPDDPEPTHAYGQVDEKGSFALSTYVNGDGAARGEYVVTIEWPERSGIMKTEFGGPDRLKGRYRDRKTSSFRFRVEKTTRNEVPAFQL
jgi:hypothetical protein